MFEARFDGELLSTDGVEHSEQPEITQELAWQISKKNLQQHKLHRTPIKILCYSTDTRTSAKEQIGYIVLDLRSAPQKPVSNSDTIEFSSTEVRWMSRAGSQAKKWFHLLNTKYKKSKPELKVALYIESITHPVEQTIGSDHGETNLSFPILSWSWPSAGCNIWASSYWLAVWWLWVSRLLHGLWGD